MGAMRQLRRSLKKNQRYEAVRRKVRSRGGFGKDVRFVSRRGGKKMSDTLLEFAGPLIDPLAPYSEQEDKIALAATCWNLSLIPSEEKDKVISGMFSRFKKYTCSRVLTCWICPLIIPSVSSHQILTTKVL